MQPCPVCGGPLSKADQERRDLAIFRAAMRSLRRGRSRARTLRWEYVDVARGAWILDGGTIPYRIGVYPRRRGWVYVIDDGVREIVRDTTPRTLARAKRAAVARAARMAEAAARAYRLIDGAEEGKRP